MKNILLAITILFISVTSLFAQKSFESDHNIISLTVGYGNTLHTGSQWKMNVPPLMASFEACLTEDLFGSGCSFGLGGFLGYASQKQNERKWKYQSYDMEYSDVVVGIRGNLHFSFTEKLDTYLGLSLGYDFVSEDGRYMEDFKLDSNTMIYGVHIGARYYFLENIAAIAEAGYNVSIISAGLSARF